MDERTHDSTSAIDDDLPEHRGGIVKPRSARVGEIGPEAVELA